MEGQGCIEMSSSQPSHWRQPVSNEDDTQAQSVMIHKYFALAWIYGMSRTYKFLPYSEKSS